MPPYATYRQAALRQSQAGQALRPDQTMALIAAADTLIATLERRLRLAEGDSTLEAEARRLGCSVVEARRQLYP